MGILSNIINKNKYSPEFVFKLCKETSLTFPINYIDEFDNELYSNDFDDEEKMSKYEGGYVECRRLSSLLLCCSLVFLKTRLKNNELPDPFKDKFYNPFIELILEDAKKINRYYLQIQLSGFFDEDGICHYNETPEYFCWKYMCFATDELIKIGNPNGQYLPKNLAFNYYVTPGNIIYNEGQILDDIIKNIELLTFIGDATNAIIPKIM